MALRFSLTGGGPLAALFSSPFKISNTEFPSDGSGTSISFTAKKNAGSVAVGGGGGISISFSSGGTTKLYLPQNLTTQYTANYQETEVSKIVANLLDSGVSGDSWDAVKSAAANQVKGLVEEGTGLSGARAAYDYRNNQVYNNHMEVMFTGMSFRQFQFDFKFFPRSQAESDQINGIIKGFKFHMHPELKPDTAGAYFIPPSTYEISITGPGAQYYNAYKESALIDMNVNYTGGGVAAQFKSGAPTEIDLSLTFKELEYNTKDDVSAGI
jgi:hypothetical protein